MTYELTVRYDSRASFYRKAIVNETKTKTTLISYDTPVCEIKNNKVKLLPDWNYSPTTLRHVKEFLKQNNFRAESKSQIEKDYL